MLPLGTVTRDFPFLVFVFALSLAIACVVVVVFFVFACGSSLPAAIPKGAHYSTLTGKKPFNIYSLVVGDLVSQTPPGEDL